MSNSKKSSDAMRVAIAFRNSGDLEDQSPGGWGASKRDDVSSQLIARLDGFVMPNQGQCGFCGPASFLFCLLMDRPDLYAHLVIDLWTNGKARLGKIELEPGRDLRRFTDAAVNGSEIEAIDWITMASVRDFDGRYKTPRTTLGEATIPYTLQKWFEAVGAKMLIDNTRVLGRANWDEFLDVSCYSSSAWVVMLINANLLAYDGSSGPGSFVANHWVVVSDEITIDKVSAPRLRPAISNRGCVNPRSTVPPDPTLPIDFKVFSWGDRRMNLRQAPNTSISEFLDRYHGAFVFSNIP